MQNQPSNMHYKVVPFSASIGNTQNSSAVASQIESLISSYTSSGWEFVAVHQLETYKAGSNGCFGLGATPPMTLTTEFIIFRQ
jgi:hypothetical protein